MARHLLTAAEVKNNKKPKLRDGDGLWLHTNKSGSRSWVFIFIRNGRRREMGLGSFGSGTGEVSLAGARTKAEEIRAILGRGGDPFLEIEERRSVIKPLTFGQVAEEYIDAMKEKWRGAKTEAGWRRFLTVYSKTLEKIPVSEVRTEDIVRTLKPIWSTKAETAGKVRERIKLVLDHARARGLREGTNPAEWKGHLDQILPPLKKLQRGHHAAMTYSDVPAFVQKLQAADSTSARALEFLILCASRSGEVRGALWSEFDLDQAVWVIPAPRMKEYREHRVPLSPRAVAIVRMMSERAISDHVFPGQRTGKPMTDMGIAKVLTTLGASDFTVHGFRSSFRDWVSEATEFQGEIAEAALAHAVGDSVERAYRRGDVLTKRRALMDAWAEFVGGPS